MADIVDPNPDSDLLNRQERALQQFLRLAKARDLEVVRGRDAKLLLEKVTEARLRKI
jgi:hypothetical protein